MKGRGVAKATAGLAIGIMLGLGVLAFKAYLAEQVTALLSDEVTASCACRFQVDAVDIHLLGLYAEARNPRIVADDKVALQFEGITADFGLGEILSKRILLKELVLSFGTAYSVGPDSPTFKFIDHLTTPIPPERDRPGRWKLRLEQLRVEKSRLMEPFTRSSLVGEGVSLLVRRDARDDFELLPSIERLRVVRNPVTNPTQPAIIELGKLTTLIHIDAQQALYKGARLAIKDSLISAEATSWNKEHDRLEGSLRFSVDSSSYDLPEWLRTALSGEGGIAGTLGRPDIQASFENSVGHPLDLFGTPDIPLASLPSVKGKLTAKIRKGEYMVDVPEFEAKGPHASLKLNTPIQNRSGQLSGGLLLSADSLVFEDGTFSDVRGQVTFEGEDGDPHVSFSGVSKSVLTHGFTFSDVTLNVKKMGQLVKVAADHNSARNGIFSAQGTISLATVTPEVQKIDYRSERFALFQSPSAQEDLLQSLRFTGSGSVHGPLGLASILGNGTWEAGSSKSSVNVLVRGDAKLEGGKLRLSFLDPSQTLQGTLAFELLGDARSALTLRADDVRMENFFPDYECVRFGGDITYDFDLTKPLAGSGSARLPKFSFGCNQYSVALEKAAALTIRDGNIETAPLSLKGEHSALLLQGGMGLTSGYAINAQGSIELMSLAALLPQFDDLRGHVQASIDVSGPIGAPTFHGKASLDNAELSSEALQLNISDIHSALTIDGTKAHIESADASLNGGHISLSGTAQLLDPLKSELKLQGSGVTFAPFENATLQLGGQLAITTLSSGLPGIEGTLRIEAAEFTKNLDIDSLLRSFSESLFAKRSTTQAFGSSLPNLDINVAVEAAGNSFIYTNWAGAELRGNLNIVGKLESPAVSGQVQTIAGWFGVRDRRFEITSGTLTFRPGSGQPLLDVIGETYLPSRTGETVLVIAEARGALLAPAISLSSDSGLSQREILNLLVAGGSIGNQTQVNTVAREFELGQESLVDQSSFLSFPRFLSSLTRINRFYFEPTFNAQTGLIEPSIIAEKRLSDALALVGESSLGSAATESRLRLLYDLSPSLRLSGIAESVSTRQNTTFGGDLTYTVLAKQVPLLEIAVKGLKSFERSQLLKGARINENSRVTTADLARIKESILAFFQGQGFFEAQAEVSCSGNDVYCERLNIEIAEAGPAKVSHVEINGDSLEGVIDISSSLRSVKGSRASEELAKSLIADLTRRLRSDGYIEARVTSTYEGCQTGPECLLKVAIRLGKPVSFVFQGNTKFSEREFLDTINLFDRTLPFGSNTINILIQSMERLYRSAGYLYVTISSEKESDLVSGRITYVVTIDEGSSIPVSSVNFEGLTRLTVQDLHAQLNERSIALAEGIFKPSYAVAEVIEENAQVLRSLLLDEGYPQAQVTYKLSPSQDESSVAITYYIDEGLELRADWFTLQGYPGGLIAPPEPAPPYSIPKANRYIDTLVDALRDQGYFEAAIWTDLAQDSQTMTIHVEPGERTRLGAIRIDGTKTVAKTVVLNELLFASGDYWDADKLQDSKRRLLRLGLFSRVDISASDGTADSKIEDVTIRVNEKPLRTLEVGAGLNSEYGLHLFGEGTDRQLFADGRALSLRVDTYYDSASAQISQGIAGLRYADPNFFGSGFSLAEDLRFQKVDLSTQEFNLDRVSLASYLYNSWNEDISLSLGHTILDENLNDVSPDAIISKLDQGNVRLSFLSGVFNYDRRDNPLNPRRGFNLSFDYKLASTAIASEANFASIGAKASLIVPGDQFLMPRFAVAFSSRAAAAWAYGDTEQIPITQRFYLGGRNSIRGFRENSLGPRGELGSVIGGDTLFANNLEFRYMALDSLSLHAFLDAGTVYLRDDSLSLGEMRYSTGIGFRYLSPIGPIGFDLGAPLDPESGEPSVRLHFSIGSNF
ncbi:MAG: translocation/assembly module TamB domain-containing protein [Oligoflexia bacterium]|nr:translocation/assembly module TamB domain-containing protein [Oligoflexia bacterium]